MHARDVFFFQRIDSNNREQEGDALLGFYQLRQDVFIEEKGWPLSSPLEGYEIDQFDMDVPEIKYFLIKDGGERVVAGLRILPTTGPHLMNTVLSHLCDKEIPTGANIIECSRSCIDKDLRQSAAGAPLYAMMLDALAGYCLDNGIVGVTLAVDVKLESRLSKMFRVERLGEPKVMDGEEIVALYAPITVKLKKSLEAIVNQPIAARAA